MQYFEPHASIDSTQAVCISQLPKLNVTPLKIIILCSDQRADRRQKDDTMPRKACLVKYKNVATINTDVGLTYNN